MRGSRVTTAQSCLQPLVSTSRYLAVHALPGDPHYFVVEAKSKVKEVYAQTCRALEQQGMQECELFGLAILSDGEYLFIDPECKLSKYAPKNWRGSHTYGLDSSGRPAFVLYFRVRYYVDSPFLLSDETTRHHYHLQLRDNVVRHGGGLDGLHPHHPLRAPAVLPTLLALAGLALQADLGDYSEDRHRPHAGATGYCKPSDYLPPHMCAEPDIAGVLAAQHRENRGLSREEAELQYIRESMFLEAPLNAHLYRLRCSKSEVGPGSILMAICARGVRIYAREDGPRTFAWNNIGKLCFDRKKFEIRGVDQPNKLTLFSGCDDKSKLLLALCRDTHQFSMAIAPRLTEAQRREEEERKMLRDCYMYPVRCKLGLTMRGSRADQRISVISSTSSNTTSGIVSDRVHSEDEPDTAPASTECLPQLTEAATHRQGSSSRPVTPAVTRNTDEVDASNATTGPQAPVALHLNSSAATAEGSQCSSSCSTVVVTAATATAAAQATSTSVPGARRCGSATSSLELGYSHTAQNSSVSMETVGFLPAGVIFVDRCKKPITPKYAGTDIGSETSGIYTLRSGSETTQDERIADIYNDPSQAGDSVQSTTDEASVTSGFYTIHSGIYSDEASACSEADPIYSVCRDGRDATVPKVDGDAVRPGTEQPRDGGVAGEDDEEDLGRSRSNSVLSAGSFRGDGTDPSGPTGPLLSADELSDLIVGRYPPRKTVSASLDSDSDYVTMPPPRPPPRSSSSATEVPGLPLPPPYPSDIGPQPPPPPYPSSRTNTIVSEKIRMPPPTPPRNDAVGPREPPPPPPPYPSPADDSRLQRPTIPPRIQPPTYPGPPDKLKPVPVHAPVAAPVVAPNSYSRLLPYRRPPPPPTGPAVTTNHGSQARTQQIEQYRQQLYSDVDYVMFPLKDPALSRQEYIEAKQGSLLSAMATRRSTPYLSTASCCSSSASTMSSSRCSSSQNLFGLLGPVTHGSNISSQYAASTSSLYSGATYSCSSGGSHGLPAPPKDLTATTALMARAKSDENILKSGYDLKPHHRRMPPPPPPPPYEIQNLERNQPLLSNLAAKPSPASLSREDKENGMLDIKTLREKSRNLDLPLISALCNDRYLLKQTKAFVVPRHQNAAESHKDSDLTAAPALDSSSRSLRTTKCPVLSSGLAPMQIAKPPRKLVSNSVHKLSTDPALVGAFKMAATANGNSVSDKANLSRASHS